MDSFKPYYNWITFNTNGWGNPAIYFDLRSFKPYYNWITFNTQVLLKRTDFKDAVLNLIITG